MSTTTVIRGLGDRPGQEISSPLLTHERARLARGTHLLDTNCSSRLELRGEGFYTEDYAPGMLVEISDRRGRKRRGLIEEVEDVLERSDEQTFTADSNINVETLL